jgi:hypothetical protein
MEFTIVQTNVIQVSESLHQVICSYSHFYTIHISPKPCPSDPLRLIRRVKNPILPPQITSNPNNIPRNPLQLRPSTLILLTKNPRKLLRFLLHIHLRLLIPQRPSQLLALLALRIPVRQTLNIRRAIDAQRAFLAVDLARRETLVTLGVVDLHAEALVLQDNDSAAVDARAADEGDVALRFGRAEECDGERDGVHADVDEAAAGEVEGEDIGGFAGEDVVVARAVGCVSEAGAVDRAEAFLLVDEVAEEFVVCFLNVAEGFDQEDFVLFRGSEQVVKLFGRGRRGFLEDDVFAGLQELFSVGVVVGVGRGDVDCLHVFVGGEGLEGGVSVLAVEFRGEGVCLLLLAGEDGVELPLVVLGGGFDPCFRDPACADGAECDGHDGYSRVVFEGEVGV